MRLISQQRMLLCFCKSESGAVTTDFVVITAAIIGLGLAVGTTVGLGGLDLAEDTATMVDTQSSDGGNRIVSRCRIASQSKSKKWLKHTLIK